MSPDVSARPAILFLCTGNACRSQMCEGWARQLKGEAFEAHSAGVAPQGLDPRAVQVMAEAGVDISGQASKHVDDLRAARFDFVVTVCDHAAEVCPLFPGAGRTIHRGFEDPPQLALGARDEAEALGHYRRVRDQIRAFIESLPEALAPSAETREPGRAHRSGARLGHRPQE